MQKPFPRISAWPIALILLFGLSLAGTAFASAASYDNRGQTAVGFQQLGSPELFYFATSTDVLVNTINLSLVGTDTTTVEVQLNNTSLSGSTWYATGTVGTDANSSTTFSHWFFDEALTTPANGPVIVANASTTFNVIAATTGTAFTVYTVAPVGGCPSPLFSYWENAVGTLLPVCSGGSPFYGEPKMTLNYVGSAAFFAPPAVYTLSAASSSITTTCPDFGFFTPLCDAVVWFFVPNLSALSSQASSTIATINAAPPFSYVAQFHSAFSATGASSTPALTIGFSGTPSTTLMGNFMPTSTTFFSASSVEAVVPSSSFTIMKFVMAMTIYFGTFELLYYSVRGIFKKKNS